MIKVLLVDDDPMITKALQIRLEAAGMEVAVGHDGVSGMRQAVQEKPDAIVLDISMPAGNGFSLARKLRDNDATVGIPLFFMTASKEPTLKDGAQQLGAVEFFEKPFDTSQIIERLHEVTADVAN